MKRLIEKFWAAVVTSFWFVPGIGMVVAILLATALLSVDHANPGWTTSPPSILYRGGAQAARTLLNVITGSLITVTGVIFSVTIVAVQLASSQYTPRVLRNFTSDHGNQATLGIFIGTFAYAVAVLRTITETGDGTPQFVPRLAITVGVGLLLLCLATLIYFVHHVATELRVTRIIDTIESETMVNVHVLFPEHLGRAADVTPPDPRAAERHADVVTACEAGYVQAVSDSALFALADHGRMVLGMFPLIGEYVLQGRPLVAVESEAPLDDELRAAIRAAFLLGPERTRQQDVEYGIVQISDIAVRALSPAINDPTTAVRCIDRLAELLVALGTREAPCTHRTRDGVVHIVAPFTSFERAVRLAFGNIRHYGADCPAVAERLLRVLGQIGSLVPEKNHGPLREQADALLASARERITNPTDRRALEDAAAGFGDATRVSSPSTDSSRTPRAPARARGEASRARP